MSSGDPQRDGLEGTAEPVTSGRAPTAKMAAAVPPEDVGNKPLPDTPYLPLQIIGEGSTGQVFIAKHVDLDSECVLKLLHFQVEDEPELADRMRLEAQALARLSHQNLVDVVDYGFTEGRPFFVMDKLGGVTLADEIAERGALPPAEVVELASQLLAGLGYVHEQGLVHRDIKPSNMLLCEIPTQGRVLKLLDFGVVKIVAAGGNHQLTPLASPTETGTSLGTPRYLAPEQAKGEPVDARTDLYAAGMVIYEMLCGRSAFAELNDMGALLLAQVLEMPEPPSAHAAKPLQPAFDTVVMKAISKDPEDRYRSAAELADALRAALEAPMPATAAGPPFSLEQPEQSTKKETPRARAAAAPSPPRPPADPTASPTAGGLADLGATVVMDTETDASTQPAPAAAAEDNPLAATIALMPEEQAIAEAPVFAPAPAAGRPVPKSAASDEAEPSTTPQPHKLGAAAATTTGGAAALSTGAEAPAPSPFKGLADKVAARSAAGEATDTSAQLPAAQPDAPGKPLRANLTWLLVSTVGFMLLTVIMLTLMKQGGVIP